MSLNDIETPTLARLPGRKCLKNPAKWRSTSPYAMKYESSAAPRTLRQAVSGRHTQPRLAASQGEQGKSRHRRDRLCDHRERDRGRRLPAGVEPGTARQDLPGKHGQADYDSREPKTPQLPETANNNYINNLLSSLIAMISRSLYRNVPPLSHAPMMVRRRYQADRGVLGHISYFKSPKLDTLLFTIVA